MSFSMDAAGRWRTLRLRVRGVRFSGDSNDYLDAVDNSDEDVDLSTDDACVDDVDAADIFARFFGSVLCTCALATVAMTLALLALVRASLAVVGV